MWLMLPVLLGGLLGVGLSPEEVIGNSVEARTLELPPAEKYDAIIGQNKIQQVVKGKGAEVGLREIVTKNKLIMRIIKSVLAGIAVLFLVLLGFKLILSQGNEEDLSKQKAQFGWIILGLIIMGVAEIAGFEVFDPTQGDVLEGNQSLTQFADLIRRLTSFFQIIIGGIAFLALIRSGMALIVSGDEDETVENEKRFIKIFLFAMLLILLSEVVARGVISFEVGGEAVIDARRGIVELAGLTNFILSFVAWAALFMVVLSSLYYVTSFGNDEQASRAKQMIIGSIIGLVLAFSAYTLVRFLV